MSRVLDASAFLAYLHDEPGADAVADAIAEGTHISSVNLAEVLGHFACLGAHPGELADDLAARGLLGVAVRVEPFTQPAAVEAARLRPLTIELGLSVADRACLALARRLGLPALTADSAWAGATPDIDVTVIR